MHLETGVLYGGPDPSDCMDGTRSLGELCWKRFTEFGDQIVLIDARTGEEVTARQLRDRSRHVAEALRRSGIGSSDMVGICSENRLEFAYIMFGVIFVGAQLTLINTTYSEDELHHVLNLSQPSIMFVTPSVAARFHSLRSQLNCCRQIIRIDGARGIGPSSTLGDFLATVDDVVPCAHPFAIEPQDIRNQVAFVLYSSGTTGLPKGVQLTQSNSIWAAARMMQFGIKHVAPIVDSIDLSVVPWFHTYGCHVVLVSTLNGGRLVYLPGFEPHAYLHAIQKYRITSISVAPPLMVFLAKSPIVDQYDLSSVRRIGCGAAPLPKYLQDAVHKRLNAPTIRQGYGMTEGTYCFTRQSDALCDPGSVGTLMVGLYGRVVHPESGRVLGANERGEMQFRGANMKGYIRNDAATDDIIGPDGWLRTGDIGYYDERGEWYIVDRLKELIKYKGFQVAPAEIEGVLLRHTAIADAGVIGVADERAGELPMAFVVKQPDAQLSETDVIEYVAGKLSTAKHLRGGVRFVAAIPKNPSGKILRRELRALWLANKSKL